MYSYWAVAAFHTSTSTLWAAMRRISDGWLGRAMVLDSFQCRGVLLHWHMVGQGPAVFAAGAGWVGYVVFCLFFFKSRVSYLPFLMLHLLGDGWTF